MNGEIDDHEKRGKVEGGMSSQSRREHAGQHCVENSDKAQACLVPFELKREEREDIGPKETGAFRPSLVKEIDDHGAGDQ